jgi:hypothetical protein
MRRSDMIRYLLVAVSLPFLLGAADRQSRTKIEEETANRQTPIVREQSNLEPATGPIQQNTQSAQSPGTRSPLYNMKRFSVHTGGDAHATSTNLRAGVFVGEAAVGRAISSSYRANVGFWLGQPGAVACPIAMTGDVNLTSGINLTDVIVLVNYVLKAGPDPEPCPAGGDVNCTGGVNSTDIIYLVNYVLIAGPAPCDACALIPGTWGCP